VAGALVHLDVLDGAPLVDEEPEHGRASDSGIPEERGILISQTPLVPSWRFWISGALV
jgi:hypothetical protein